MGLQVYRFVNTIEFLLNNKFIETPVGAQLLDGGYEFNITHSTRADFDGHFVGTPVNLVNKTVTTDAAYDTILDCDDLDWASQGGLKARYVLIHFWAGTGAGITTDKVIAVIDLDDQAREQEITPAVKVSLNGLLIFPFAATSTTPDKNFGFLGSSNSCGFASVNDL